MCVDVCWFWDVLLLGCVYVVFVGLLVLFVLLTYLLFYTFCDVCVEDFVCELVCSYVGVVLSDFRFNSSLCICCSFFIHILLLRLLLEVVCLRLFPLPCFVFAFHWLILGCIVICLLFLLWMLLL